MSRPITRPLGRDQLGMLRQLAEHRHWYGGGFGCGWNWGTPLRTERLLASLVKRGLVSTTLQGETLIYRITPTGRAVVEQAARVKP